MAPESDDLRPDFSKVPVLSGERIILRGIELCEAAAIMDVSVYDGVFAENEAGAVNILKQINTDIANGESLHWGIFLKETNEVAGTCGFYRGFAGNSGEIGYILKDNHQGQGLMTEAVKLIVEFGFQTLKLRSVAAFTDPGNLASIAVLRRAGFSEARSPNAERKFVKKRR